MLKRKRPNLPECWACGALCPSGTRVTCAGWASRVIEIRGMHLTECYCGECFRQWGWPPLPSESESGLLNASAPD
jgi:hypothetical protein